MKNLNLRTLAVLPLFFFMSCTKEPTAEAVVQDWHPAINKQLEQLDQNNILTFGKLEKDDGRYCYVSYEGFMRDEKVLANAKVVLDNITAEIDKLLKTEFSLNAQDISKKRDVKSVEEFTAAETSYLQKRSEMECLKVLAERQAIKYSKRISDRRVGLK